MTNHINEIIENNVLQQERLKVAILGATGIVGQVFVHMLENHPWFERALLSGSSAREGKRYGDEVRWQLPVPIRQSAASQRITALDAGVLKDAGVDVVFSALPADVAREVEPGLREAGFYVFSNAGALRYDEDVPILIPEVNEKALELIDRQGFPGKGFVVTNANCSTTGLAAALAPLVRFNIREVYVSTYQSVSGAGYPGLAALDILNDAIPFIEKEEEKMIGEVQKILGLDLDVYPHCVRIPVPFGHQETVWLTLDDDVTDDAILDAWKKAGNGLRDLPTQPEQPVVYCDSNDEPRPGMSFWGNPPGMQVFTGRLRRVNGKIGFNLVVNNLVKGAAGGSIVNAELFVKLCAQRYGNGLRCGGEGGQHESPENGSSRRAPEASEVSNFGQEAAAFVKKCAARGGLRNCLASVGGEK